MAHFSILVFQVHVATQFQEISLNLGYSYYYSINIKKLKEIKINKLDSFGIGLCFE